MFYFNDKYIYEQGDRGDAQEITAFWKNIFQRKSLIQKNISKGRRW